MLGPGGTYLEIGTISRGAKIELEPAQLVWGAKKIVGVIMYDPWVIPRALDFLVRNRSRFAFDKLISNTYPLEKINDAFAACEWHGRDAGTDHPRGARAVRTGPMLDEVTEVHRRLPRRLPPGRACHRRLLRRAVRDRADGCRPVNPTRIETERFFDDVETTYRLRGFTHGDILTMNVQPLGSNSALATVQWGYRGRAKSCCGRRRSPTTCTVATAPGRSWFRPCTTHEPSGRVAEQDCPSVAPLGG